MAKTYVYPDGTVAFRRPHDGELFYIRDNAAGPYAPPKSTWQWDDFKEQWFDIARRPQIMTGARVKLYVNGQLIGYANDVSVTIEKAKKCECGSEKAGSNRHSTWCQKYTD